MGWSCSSRLNAKFIAWALTAAYSQTAKGNEKKKE